jgi:uncharacterized membrane protein
MAISSNSKADQRLKLAITLCLALWVSLLIGFGVWQMTRPGGPIYGLWFAQWLPLLIVAPGLWHKNPRAYIGLCFILLLYFIKAVEGMFRPQPLWIDYWVLADTVTLFCCATMTARWLRHASGDLKKSP